MQNKCIVDIQGQDQISMAVNACLTLDFFDLVNKTSEMLKDTIRFQSIPINSEKSYECLMSHHAHCDNYMIFDMYPRYSIGII